jgi:hypothetical protein
MVMPAGPPLPAASPSVEHSLATPSTTVVVARKEEDQAFLEAFVHEAAGGSKLSTPAGIETVGTVMGNVSSIATSDSFNIVMGFLDKFVQIGNAVAEVSQLSL